mmetsp:Transcript_4448/g.11219  ORF Transcript_4448/g.11219 Transcript_4448/m.11219 type:complete len:83 (+) Transcript_4448:272-520(+)
MLLCLLPFSLSGRKRIFIEQKNAFDSVQIKMTTHSNEKKKKASPNLSLDFAVDMTIYLLGMHVASGRQDPTQLRFSSWFSWT